MSHSEMIHTLQSYVQQCQNLKSNINQDIIEITREQNYALKDPIQYVEHLMSGQTRDLPPLQIIPNIPHIDFGQQEEEEEEEAKKSKTHEIPKVKKGRGRPKKNPDEPKKNRIKRRGRPRKHPIEQDNKNLPKKKVEPLSKSGKGLGTNGQLSHGAPTAPPPQPLQYSYQVATPVTPPPQPSKPFVNNNNFLVNNPSQPLNSQPFTGMPQQNSEVMSELKQDGIMFEGIEDEEEYKQLTALLNNYPNLKKKN